MNEDRKLDWKEIKTLYPVGSKITGKVEHHAPFGIFLDIGHPVVKGLIQITDFLDEGVMSPRMYPPIGHVIKAVVLAYTPDQRNQIWLSVKPSVLSQPELQPRK